MNRREMLLAATTALASSGLANAESSPLELVEDGDKPLLFVLHSDKAIGQYGIDKLRASLHPVLDHIKEDTGRTVQLVILQPGMTLEIVSGASLDRRGTFILQESNVTPLDASESSSLRLLRDIEFTDAGIVKHYTVLNFVT